MTILQMPVRQLGLMVNSFARASIPAASALLCLHRSTRSTSRTSRARSRCSSPRATLRFEDVALHLSRGHRILALKGITFEGRARRDHRHSRRARQRQVDRGQSHPALLRRHLGRRHHRWAGRARRDAGIAAPAGRRGAAGLFPLHHHDREQHRLWRSLGQGTPRSRRRRKARSSTITSWACRPTTTPSWASAGCRSRAASASASPLRAASSCARRSWCSTIQPPPSTPAPSTVSARPSAPMPRDRVTIIIAHRLSSLMHADTILFLEDGAIVERGSHAELLALGGRYSALYDLQTRPTEDIDVERAAQ